MQFSVHSEIGVMLKSTPKALTDLHNARAFGSASKNGKVSERITTATRFGARITRRCAIKILQRPTEVVCGETVFKGSLENSTLRLECPMQAYAPPFRTLLVFMIDNLSRTKNFTSISSTPANFGQGKHAAVQSLNLTVVEFEHSVQFKSPLPHDPA